ncbi:MAG: TlpA family protein disulfide reductase [Verrucomicrobia bacterium]|nr:TlpA family protein disulfide reductase [Verrucomicrobiota bacterium]
MNGKMKAQFLRAAFALGTLAVLGALVAELTQPATVRAEKARLKSPAPAWELKDVEGKLVKSADFKGKVVILDFWATWCGPCRMEIPGFVSLQKKYGKDGLVIVGVSLDDEGATVLKPFIKKHSINYTVVLGDEKVSKAFGGVDALPTTFIIDRTGLIVSQHVGYAPEATFAKEIKPLLKQ